MQISNRLVKYLVLSGLALFLGGQVSRVNAQNWYNTSWAYRTPVPITNSTAGTLTNFQVHVTLDGGFDFTKALSTGADLRVSDSNGTSLLNFWIENWSQTNSTASIWVLVPSIPIAGTTIYLYYGNPSATTNSSGTNTFMLFDDFEGLNTTAATGYWTLGSATTALQQTQAWETTPPHSLSVVSPAANTYNGYYGLYDGTGVGMATSTNLSSWTKYASNPLIINARWPSVVLDSGGTYHMFYTADYATTSHIEYNTSTDGINFTVGPVGVHVGTIVGADSNGYPRNQNPNLFYNPITARYYLYYYTGNDTSAWEIHERNSTTVAGLATASDVTVLSSYNATLAAPNMFCFDTNAKSACTGSTSAANALYLLSTETEDGGGVWNVEVWSSTSPTSGFKLTPAVNSGDISPVMTDNSACMAQYQFGTTLYVWYCNLDSGSGTWTQLRRTVSITATRPTYQQPYATTWTNVGGAAWAVVTDTQQDGTSGKVAKAIMTSRQSLHSGTLSPSDFVVDAYGKQITGNVWGIAARAKIDNSATPPIGEYYSTQLYDNQNSATPPDNLFLYGWLPGDTLSASFSGGTAAVGNVNPNIWYRLREAVSGTNIYSYKDDVLQISSADGSITGGGAALYGEGPTIAEFNNVFVRKYASADPTATPGATPALVLSSLTLSSSSVTGGVTPYPTGTVTLASAASSSMTVTLSSDTPSVASVPSSVSFSTGNTSKNFTVTTYSVATTTQVTITASYHGASIQTILTVNPAAPAITSADHVTFTAGAAGTFTVTATGTPTPTLSESGALPTGVTFNATTGVLSGTPAAGTGGTYALTFTASNGVGSPANQNFTLTVNEPPQITSANNLTLTVGTAGSITVTATGYPAAITFSETGTLPNGVTLNATTGVLGGTPAASTGGSYPITITAQNGVTPNATQSFTLTVNQAPAITSANNATFRMGTAGSFTVTATGYPAPTFSEAGLLPSGVTLNATTGALSGTAAATGTFPITITATNGVGTDATQSFTLVVNQPPAITSITTATFTVGTAGSFTMTATGYPAPTFSETGALPSGVTLNATTGVLGGTPAAGTGNSYPITITATNGVGADATQGFTLTVNEAPAITSPNATGFTVNTAGSFTVTATGYPAPTLSETGALPDGVTFNATTGVLSGTATTTGTYAITFKASNGVGADATQGFTLVVNQAPTITSANSAMFTVNTAGSFTVTATGYPAPTFSETGALPTGVTLNATTGVLGGTATTTGTYPITITATNGVGSNATQNFTLTVGQAPAITSANHAGFVVNTAGSFTVTATGYPAPTFSETGALPTGVTLNATTGVLSGTATTSGAYPITITATNGVGSDATQSFTLTVGQAPAITSANNLTLTVGTAGSITVTATGYPVPTFSETGALPSGVTLNATTGVLGGTPAAGTGGSYPITITASNGVGTAATQNFTLTVDQAPAITSANHAGFVVNTAGSFTVTATGYPAPTFSQTSAPSGVTLNATTGVLSGTATTSGMFPITITATNGVGSDATQSFTLTVGEAPAITSANSLTLTVGTAGSITVTATGYPAATFSETGALPSGVTLNATTGVLGGTPATGTGGSYPITITASNGVGSNATQSFTLTVNEAPHITSANHAGFVVNTAGSFTVTATGYPAPTFSETGGLPSGVTLNATTGVLSGTPANGTNGTYPITITATNGVGTDATQSFTLTVGQAPAISSLTSATFQVGVAGSFTVTATGFPAPTFSETGALPSGVTLNATTGVLGGTPAAGTGSSYPITITATNGVGTDATQNFTLTVQDFTVAPASTSQTVTAGGTATYNLDITAVNGLTGSVSFTCTGAPTAATCSVTPSVTIPGTATVTVSTTSRSAVPIAPKPPTGPWIWLWILALVAAAGTRLLAGRRLAWSRAWAPLAVAMLSVALWAGCGGGGGGGTPIPHGTPAGTYTLTVTATYTGTTAKQNITLTLHVN
jgi:hypothetical protein